MPICQAVQQIMDWQPHFENSEPYRGIQGMTYRFRETKEQTVIRNQTCE